MFQLLKPPHYSAPPPPPPPPQFSRATTSQLIKWFSNFREFYYIQMEKFARQALTEGVNDASHLQVSRNGELFRALNLHYNKSNEFRVSCCCCCCCLFLKLLRPLNRLLVRLADAVAPLLVFWRHFRCRVTPEREEKCHVCRRCQQQRKWLMLERKFRSSENRKQKRRAPSSSQLGVV